MLSPLVVIWKAPSLRLACSRRASSRPLVGAIRRERVRRPHPWHCAPAPTPARALPIQHFAIAVPVEPAQQLDSALESSVHDGSRDRKPPYFVAPSAASTPAGIALLVRMSLRW